MIDYSEIKTGQLFEQFCEGFLNIMGYRILKPAGSGPDRGRDIVCSERLMRTGEFRWLVSCKHYNKAIGQSDDETRLDKLDEHGCHGFMYIYSSGATDSRIQSIENTCRNRSSQYGAINFDILSGFEMTAIILKNAEFHALVRQYMPLSYEKMCRVLDRGYTCKHCADTAQAMYVISINTPNTREPEIYVLGEDCMLEVTEHANEAQWGWSSYTIYEPEWW